MKRQKAPPIEDKLVRALGAIAWFAHLPTPLLLVYAMLWVGMRHGDGRSLYAIEAVIVLVPAAASVLAVSLAVVFGTRRLGPRQRAFRDMKLAVPVGLSIAMVCLLSMWGVSWL